MKPQLRNVNPSERAIPFLLITFFRRIVMRKSILNRVLLGLSISFGLFALVSDSFAEAINMDLYGIYHPGTISGTYTSTGAAPDAGTTWNTWAPSTAGTLGGPTGADTPAVLAGTSPTLVNSLGAVPSVAFGTNVTFSITGTNWNGYDWGYNTPPYAPALLGDGLYGGGSLATAANFTIDGLVAFATYDLYLYSQNGGHQSQTTNFLVGGTTKQAANPGVAAAFVNNQNYVVYVGIAADVSGQIAGKMWQNDGNGSAFNGFQLVQSVPEPTAISLFGLGALGLFAVRRRRVAG
jgi:hypothetical protein